MNTKHQYAVGGRWENTLKGLVLGAAAGSLTGLTAGISLVFVSGSSFELALVTLAVFTTMLAGIGGFIGVLIDLDQHERISTI